MAENVLWFDLHNACWRSVLSVYNSHVLLFTKEMKQFLHHITIIIIKYANMNVIPAVKQKEVTKELLYTSIANFFQIIWVDS